ncbi:MAG: acetyl-CoA C-acyltransferase [Planctomycetales bacterium]|nr:acetyl-CoA C-acyltransferase [Planctomycetales bacterium]
MNTSYLVSAARTPIGRFMGAFRGVAATELGAVAVRAALDRAAVDPRQVQEVIIGNVLTAGVGQAPARQAALRAGCSPEVAAVTINMVCGSGLKAVMQADQLIRAGDGRMVVAGGMENMSRSPHLLMDSRRGWRFGDQRVLDSMQHDGLWCASEQVLMGKLADATARECGISRADQDAWALTSHQRATRAIDEGWFRDEIAPVTVASSRGPIEVSSDEGPRADCSLDSLLRLSPAFAEDASRDETDEARTSCEATVTAGNASQISDGAAAVVVVDEATARSVDSPWKARIVATATHGVAPADLFLAPIGAIRDVCRQAGVDPRDVDLIELNEAFAAQTLACQRSLGLDIERLNIHGGAIALGHPIGASGARVLVTLLYAMHRRQARTGLASLCLGGGNAVAMLVERFDASN